MPGLTGLCTRQISGFERLGEMILPMLHRPDYKKSEYTEPYFGCGAVDLPGMTLSAKAVCEESGNVLFIYGSIFEEGLQGPVDRQAQQLLELWVEKGWKAAMDLNGEYLVVVWNSKTRKLQIVNDRLGLKRLQYWTNGENFAFASEVKSLAVLSEVNRGIDEVALTELLIFGHMQADHTLLRSVRLLPAASCLTWERGKLDINTYWDYEFKADSKFADSEAARTEYSHQVEAAVKRRLEGHKRVGLLLSGGLDSRALAGFIGENRDGKEFRTWTAGHGHDHDTHFARRIARVVGSTHESVMIPENFLEIYGPEYSWVLDGMASAHGAHRQCLMPQASAGSDAVFIGYMGDTVSGGKPLDDIAHITDYEELLKAGFELFEKGLSDEQLKQVLRPEIYERVRGQARDIFRETAAKARVEHVQDRIVYAELFHRQRLWNPLAQMDLMGLSTQVMLPYADKHFIDFSVSLPYEQRCRKEAYIKMICGRFPKLARVPRSGDGLPIVHSRLEASLHWKKVLFRRNVLPKLTGGKWGGHLYAPFVHCREWFQEASRQYLFSVFSDETCFADKFNMNGLKRLLGDYLNNRLNRDISEGIASLTTYAEFKKRLEQLPAIGSKPGKRLAKAV